MSEKKIDLEIEKNLILYLEKRALKNFSFNFKVVVMYDSNARQLIGIILEICINVRMKQNGGN